MASKSHIFNKEYLLAFKEMILANNLQQQSAA
jgi:hypothetical protein